jgi:hypothetical protein
MTDRKQSEGQLYTIGEYTYFMTYFEAQFTGSGEPRAVADQFTSFVSHYATSGFEFYRSDSIPYRVTPGCLAGLFGAKESFGYTTVVSFRKRL